MFIKRCLSLVMIALLVQPQLLICGDELDDQQNTQSVKDQDKTGADLDKVSTPSKQKKEIKIDVKVNEDGSASFVFSTGNRSLDLLLLVVLVGGGAWKCGCLPGSSST